MTHIKTHKHSHSACSSLPGTQMCALHAERWHSTGPESITYEDRNRFVRYSKLPESCQASASDK